MRWISSLLLLIAGPAAAQVGTFVMPPSPAPWNPAADYITIGQDEAGYRNWYMATPVHATRVQAFNTYLAQYGVSGIVPTWQLLRTATSWHRCGGQPFEVPPTGEWPHIVQTLRYVHDYVIPTVGPVEAVSAYRNPSLNACAGGAPESAHKHYSAIDMVPLTQITRTDLMRKLCAVHARRGTAYDVGLGFYAFLRFHVDTTRFRRWGADPNVASCPAIIRPTDVASVAQPIQPQGAQPATADPAALSGPKVVFAPPVPDPVATTSATTDTQPQQR